MTVSVRPQSSLNTPLSTLAEFAAKFCCRSESSESIARSIQPSSTRRPANDNPERSLVDGGYRSKGTVPGMNLM